MYSNILKHPYEHLKLNMIWTNFLKYLSIPHFLLLLFSPNWNIIPWHLFMSLKFQSGMLCNLYVCFILIKQEHMVSIIIFLPLHYPQNLTASHFNVSEVSHMVGNRAGKSSKMSERRFLLGVKCPPSCVGEIPQYCQLSFMLPHFKP